MAITHTTTTRNALAQAVADAVENGAGTAVIRIKTSGGVTLVDIPLPSPAFGSPANGVVTLLGTPISAQAVATGTAATFELLSRAGDVVLTGSAGTTGDVSLDNTSIASGQTVTLQSFYYQAAP